jgi:uncharacterized protein
MLLISTYVAQSAIEGLGVFAGEPAAKGSLIWDLHPKFDIFIEVAETESLPPHMQVFIERYGYPHLDMPGVVVLDADNGKYMNHSMTPNTDFRLFDKGYALVDIAAGDEITCNYYEFDPTFAGSFTDLIAGAGHQEIGRHTNGR